jgi:hypothetical protein
MAYNSLDQSATGAAFMQSGRSLLPALGEKVPGLRELADGFVDEFAIMEDEFDDGIVQPRIGPVAVEMAENEWNAAKVSIVRYCSDPLLYLETLLFIGVFAVAHNAFRWARHARTERASPKSVRAEAASGVATIVREREMPEFFGALCQAIRDDDAHCFLQLLKEGGHGVVRHEDACGCTALHIAANCGKVEMARQLLDHRAKVDARELWEETPLHFAARRGSLEVCEVLLSYGADINAVNAQGWTPLLSAADGKQEAVCELLLSKEAGAAGIAEEELPQFLNTLLVRRVLSGTCYQEPEQVDDA